MKTTSVRRAALSCTLLASTASLALAASPVHAQAASPAFRNLDANGVDLVLGDFVMSFEEGSIGSGKARLAILRQNAANGFSQWDGYTFRKTVNGATTTIDVGREGRFVDRFVNGVPSKANGTTIATSPGGYTYTLSDGTKIAFTHLSGGDLGITNFCGTSGTSVTCELAPTTITTPDGATVTLGWQYYTYPGSPQNGQPTTMYAWRLFTVSNSFSYRLRFNYSTLGNGGGSSPPPTSWFQRTGAKLFNDNVSTTVPQATIGYAYPGGGVVQVTDMAGKVWEITDTSIKRPGEATPGFLVLGSVSAVTGVTRDGATTSYTRTVNGSTLTMVVKDALNDTTTITSDVGIGRPGSVKDALNHTTNYSYDTNNRLTDVTQHEGDRVHYYYDGRGNIYQTDFVPKPTSGLATISTFASFDATCANPVTCNEPNSTKDALGNQTDYVWDGTHGGLKTVTLPAASTGAPRPQTRYIYSLLNGEYQLTGTSQCQTTSATGTSPVCGTAADEAVQSFGYDSNGNMTSSRRWNDCWIIPAASKLCDRR